VKLLDQSTGGANLFWIDPSKGYCCTHAEYRDGENVVAVYDFRLANPMPGIWIPDEYAWKTYDGSGNMTSASAFTLEDGSISINGHPYERQLFELRVPPGAEVSDYSAGMKLVYREGIDAFADIADIDLLIKDTRRLLPDGGEATDRGTGAAFTDQGMVARQAPLRAKGPVSSVLGRSRLVWLLSGLVGIAAAVIVSRRLRRTRVQ